MNQEVQTPVQETPVDQAPAVEGTPVAPAPAPAPTKTRQMSFTVLDTGVIQAEFGEGIEKLELDPSKVPESLISAAVAEGLINRARGYTSKLVEKDRTPAALHAAISKAFTNLLAGVWKIERPAGESDYTIEQEAAWIFRQMRAEAQKVPVEGDLAAAASAFTALTDEQKKSLKALPRYQLAMAKVKADRAAAKQAELLAKLDKEGEDVGF